MVAYAAQRAGRHGWACLAVCAAGILKFYPFVLLPWFVWTGGGMRGRWYRLMGGMGFVIAVVVLTGSGLWRELFQYGIPMGVGEEIGRTFHFSLPALVTNLGYLYHDFHLSPAAKQWWWLAGTSAGLAVIAAAYVACLSTHRDPEAEFCRLCVAMLMGTVTVQGCYFVFLVFPLAVAGNSHCGETHARESDLFDTAHRGCELCRPPTSPFLWRHVLLYILIGNLPLYGLFGLGVFSVGNSGSSES
jgi:hypothetical protein